MDMQEMTTQELIAMIKTLNERLEIVEALLSYHYNVDLIKPVSESK